LTFARIADRLFRDKQGHVVIVQPPNIPLWVWIIARLTAIFLEGQPRTIVMAIATLALAVWAVMEIGWGVNLFRRLLGAAVMISILAGIYLRFLR